jgi:hypothetical protein
MSEISNISLEELELAWNFQASVKFKASYAAKNLTFTEIESQLRDNLIVAFLKALDSDLPTAGEHREQIWENGWNENLLEYRKSSNLDSLRPKYFSKIPQIRWRQKWITPVNQYMEYQLFELLLDLIFESYLSESSDIYEFGCGTGNNLLRMRNFNRNANITGLDWARSSQSLIGEIAVDIQDAKMYGEHFDYFNPNSDFKLAKNSSVVTVASLEQTGKDFKKFIDYLIANRPEIVIHIEPIGEVLDENELLDNLSLRYFKKRNYLDGLVDHVKELEKQGKVEILRLSRTYVGSFYIDGYTLLMWRPK